mmetsp:Transcript_6140/g.15153  ORF Transcript_6140/g.15153 Transcript_6140/m.15153 type:complete len:251 (+) Transcript_6140:175-927(+)
MACTQSSTLVHIPRGECHGRGSDAMVVADGFRARARLTSSAVTNVTPVAMVTVKARSPGRARSSCDMGADGDKDRTPPATATPAQRRERAAKGRGMLDALNPPSGAACDNLDGVGSSGCGAGGDGAGSGDETGRPVEEGGSVTLGGTVAGVVGSGENGAAVAGPPLCCSKALSELIGSAAFPPPLGDPDSTTASGRVSSRAWEEGAWVDEVEGGPREATVVVEGTKAPATPGVFRRVPLRGVFRLTRDWP